MATNKKELIRDLCKGQPIYTQVLIGKAFDRGAENGYSNGFHDANHYGSTVFIACTLLALHDVFGFGGARMARLVPAIYKYLFDTLSATEAVERCQREFGVTIVDSDLFEEA